MIEANKDNVKFTGSPELVTAEMIAIMHEFVMWQIVNGDGPVREIEKAGIELYETWKNREES